MSFFRCALRRTSLVVGMIQPRPRGAWVIANLKEGANLWSDGQETHEATVKDKAAKQENRFGFRPKREARDALRQC